MLYFSAFFVSVLPSAHLCQGVGVATQEAFSDPRVSQNFGNLLRILATVCSAWVQCSQRRGSLNFNTFLSGLRASIFV